MGVVHTNDFIMGLSAVGDRLYAGVGTGESIQVRKLLGNAGWKTIMEFSGEAAPSQIQPTVFIVDSKENAYFAEGNKVISYLPDGGKGQVYELKESVAFLREKEYGVIEAVTNSRQEICLYSLGENGNAKKMWTIELPSAQAVEIRTDDAVTLCLAADGVLYLDGKTEGNVGVWQKLFQMAEGAGSRTVILPYRSTLEE